MEPNVQIVGVMFADVVGYSKLKEPHVKLFLTHITPQIAAKVIDPHREHLLELNTWGDGIIVASRNPYKLTELALDLRDFYRNRNWGLDGLPKLTVRVALHTGPVFVGHDPIRKIDGIIGTQVNLAARIEPITPPGEVYVSQQFFHIIPKDQDLPFAFDELGDKDLAKQYGSAKLYRLRREWETPPTSAASAKEKEKAGQPGAVAKGGVASAIISVASLEERNFKFLEKPGVPSTPPPSAASLASAFPLVVGIPEGVAVRGTSAEDVSHPRSQAQDRGDVHRCRFLIMSPKYLQKSRWATLADVLVEVIGDLPQEDWTREAYLIPSARALPKLRDTEFLRNDPKLLRKKREATERFIKEWENRELQGAWFSLPTKKGKSVGVYCLAYDLFLNASVSGQI